MTERFAAKRAQNLRWGNAMIQFCGWVLIGSSIVKFLHLSGAMDYMASMGYERGTLNLVAVVELSSAVLFLVRRTRLLGLLLVSSYLGAAIAGHLAIHRFFDRGGPFVEYMATHRYTGSLIPAAFLLLAWTGTWLAHPGLAERADRKVDNAVERQFEPSGKVALGSNT